MFHRLQNSAIQYFHAETPSFFTEHATTPRHQPHQHDQKQLALARNTAECFSGWLGDCPDVLLSLHNASLFHYWLRNGKHLSEKHVFCTKALRAWYRYRRLVFFFMIS
jgi:hypothetical protein